MAEAHGWHLFDAERDLYVQQVTGPGEPDRYEVRKGEHGDVTVLTGDEFEDFRGPGPKPKGLD